MPAFKAVNWNRVEDQLDKDVWDRLTANFWLPEKVAVSNDLDSWRKMTETEREVIRKVFATLTALDTLQSEVGVEAVIQNSEITQHEHAVYNNIAFMESVHAKSYSTIFSTLCSTQEIDELFQWVQEDKLLQQQIHEVQNGYLTKVKQNREYALIYSVFLESMLFYTGFYAPLKFASEAKLTNTADIIRLILRDEGVHGFYIGAKYQKHYTPNPDMVYEVLFSLLETEYRRCEQLYDGIGWTEDVKTFLRYNANKALANLGVEPAFSPEQTNIPAAIKAALDPGTGEAHDFFSGSGASYVMGKVEELSEEDWGF